MKRNEKTIYVGKGTKLTIIEEKSLPPGTIIIEGAMPVDLTPVNVPKGKRNPDLEMPPGITLT